MHYLTLAGITLAVVSGCATIATSSAADHMIVDRFYVTKICTEYTQRDDFDYCDNGYVLKSEATRDGDVAETVLAADIGRYGWHHTIIKQLDADTYHLYMGCGSPCGNQFLLGRGDQVQYLPLYADIDLNSRCTVELDPDKQMWVARRFFSEDSIDLPATYGPSPNAAYPKYDVQFAHDGRVVIKEYFADNTLQTLPNPCRSV